MPFDPDTGTWKTEDDSVEGKVTGLVSQDSPLIQQAREQGAQSANRRGLLNSSIAAGASQAAAYNVALPIAQQDATQTAQKNLESEQQQGRVGITNLQTASSERIEGSQEQAAMSRLIQQGHTQEDIQAMSDAASKERLGIQLTSEEKRAADLYNNNITVAGIQGQTTRDVNTANNQTQVKVAGMGNQTQVTVAAGGAASSARSNYVSNINTINNNPNIPSDVRASLLVNAQKGYESDIKAISSLFGVTIPFEIPPTDGGGAPADPTAPDGGGGQV
jgi:hypothetical protein